MKEGKKIAGISRSVYYYYINKTAPMLNLAFKENENID